ncbi:U4/U6 small nuclear ribonucleoprotein prp4 [Coemansia helicoidea]|uniref:U4/U6 small nuclear ribonucleoprotein prp4 n=1 Tax=Coemansia helicoidea TaxID=1286919 RepID=A0ACC1L403_9FUNG|nr:U4/U6 small nuclear ribonucleoprotein prp4 [Coemansia helicoidea]
MRDRSGPEAEEGEITEAPARPRLRSRSRSRGADPDRGRSRSPAPRARPRGAAGSGSGVRVNNGRGAAASDGPVVPADFVLSFDKDDEAEAQRALEERRRRREAILQKHAAQTDSPSASSSAVSDSPSTRERGPPSVAVTTFALGRGGGASVQGMSAADYDPSADPKANSARHRVAVAAAAVTTSTKSMAAAPAAAGDGGSDDDGFDMFADTDEVVEARPHMAGTGVSAAASLMADSWDDSDGYYRTIVGELLDDRYLVQAFLGQGVFSSVVRAVDTRQQNAPVAIKIIRQNELMHRAGVKEQRVLERLQAADPADQMHVVRLTGSFAHRGHLCLCFELMSMNLREVVRKYGRATGLSLQAVRVYGTHLLLALDLLRRCGVVHGDVKPDNCFVSEQRNAARLGDLGSACDVGAAEITPYLVSRFYRAPEIILGLPYDGAVDVWSLGATLFELYTGRILFPGRDNNHMLRLMMEARGHIPNRMLRRGQFWQQHFEDNGGSTMDFVARATDPLSGAASERRMVFARPALDIRARVLQATPDAAPEDTQQALRFASLLERCLELSPEKRIAPIDALRHPFFAEKQ